jgi:hypothetical protein
MALSSIIESKVGLSIIGMYLLSVSKINWYSGTRNIVILWTLVDNFFYNFGVTFITNLKRVINLL